MRGTVDIRYNLRSRKRFRGLYGYQYRKGSVRRIVVNLDFHDRERRRMHRGVGWLVRELVCTINHEVLHAFAPQDIPPRSAKARREEELVQRLERYARN